MKICEQFTNLYFSYFPGILSYNLDDIYPYITDKCISRTSKTRRSCIFLLHPINISVDYGITTYEFKEVPQIVHDIRSKIEKFSNTVFDYVLVHIYHEGSSIGWHGDSEALNSPVLSVSFGATRKFRLKDKRKSTGYNYEMSLNNGDIVIMHKGCQQKYKHCVPVEKRVKGLRINFTFRQFEF